MIFLIIAIAIGVFLGNMAFKKEVDQPGTAAAAVLKVRYGLKYAIAYPIAVLAILFVVCGFIAGTLQNLGLL
jgi:hypothetical protein